MKMKNHSFFNLRANVAFCFSGYRSEKAVTYAFDKVIPIERLHHWVTQNESKLYI